MSSMKSPVTPKGIRPLTSFFQRTNSKTPNTTTEKNDKRKRPPISPIECNKQAAITDCVNDLPNDSPDIAVNNPKKSKRQRTIIDSDEENGEQTKTCNVSPQSSKSNDAFNAIDRDSDQLPDIGLYAFNEITGSSLIEDNSIKVSYNQHGIKTKKIEKVDEPFVYDHMKFAFLQPGSRKDKLGRRETDENFDKSTLHVPIDFLKKQTPGFQQWWEYKSQHYDTILFFKVGKFYEFYHEDALIVADELGIAMMKGNYAHCGFPEASADRYMQILASKYKVARIDQTQRPQDMAKGQKVVKRELTEYTSAGLLAYSIADSLSKKAQTQDKYASENMAKLAPATFSNTRFMLSLCERADRCKSVTIGACVAEISTSTFQFAQFVDSDSRAALRTLLARFPPVQINLPSKDISHRTMRVIESIDSTALIDKMTSSQFIFESAAKKLCAADCFGDWDHLAVEQGTSKWPKIFASLIDNSDKFGRTPNKDFDLTLRAFASIIDLLFKADILQETIVDANFEIFNIDNINEMNANYSSSALPPRMVIDELALGHLYLVPKPGDSQLVFRSTLFHVIDHCQTAFGRRLLRSWLCSPPANASEIRERQHVIQCLESIATSDNLRRLNLLPDLPRQINRAHQLASKRRATTSSISRAIVDTERETQQRLSFLKSLSDSLIEAVRIVESVLTSIRSDNMPAVLIGMQQAFNKDVNDVDDHLKELLCQPDLSEQNKQTKANRMKKSEHIKPPAILDIEEKFEEYLQRIKKKFNTPELSYWGTGRARYQIEFPNDVSKRLDHTWRVVSSKKTHRRYRNAELDAMFEQLEKAEIEHSNERDDDVRQLFERFDEKHVEYKRLIDIVAMLDAYYSLVRYRENSQVCMVMPVIEEVTDTPILHIDDGVHPTMVQTQGAQTVIANDLHFDADMRIMLLTGPNMGGKSTLMRQAALLAILAQLGSYVPARAMRLSPVDRVFTRIGAHDCILKGQSTFHIEMSELAGILRNATKHSLLLIDELGRGTSIEDGSAIALQTLRYINKIMCPAPPRTFFATHYHALVDELAGMPNIVAMHMACAVETRDPMTNKWRQVKEEDWQCHDRDERVTFLYKLSENACPESYGFYAAKVARVPPQVISRARLIASLMETPDHRQESVGIHQRMLEIEKLHKRSEQICCDTEQREKLQRLSEKIKALMH